MNELDLDRVQAALSSHYRELIFLTPETCPPTLLQALATHFPHIPPSEWTARVSRGGTYVNGEVVLEDLPLPVPCRIEYYEPKDSSDDERLLKIGAEISHFVVHEDEDLLVLYKPKGIATLPTREQRFLNLKTFLLSYLQKTRGNDCLHMPSRVDTSVQGLVIVSTSLGMHARLQRAFENRRAKKVYMLATDREVSWQTLRADKGIDRDPRHPVLRQAVDHGGKPSLTEFEVRWRGESEGIPAAIIEARPVTGRTHQIRLHASAYGLPIIGDNFYGGRPASELHLVSYRLELPDPRTGKMLVFQAPESFLPRWLKSPAGSGHPP